MPDLPPEAQIITTSINVAGQGFLHQYPISVSKAPGAATRWVMTWDVKYKRVNAYENLDLALPKDFRDTRHFTHQFLLGLTGPALTFMTSDIAGAWGPDRRHTYDGVQDYGGPSGRSVQHDFVTSGVIDSEDANLASIKTALLAALSGGGSATIGWQVAFQDSPSPPAAPGSAAWANSDYCDIYITSNVT